MSVTSLRPIQRHAAQPLSTVSAASFGAALMRAGHIDAQTLMAAIGQTQIPLVEYLIQRGDISENAAYQAMSAHWVLGLADTAQMPIDASLLTQVDASHALAGHFLPWRRLGASVVVLCAYPEEIDTIRSALMPIFGHVSFALAPRRVIDAQIMAKAGRTLARRAETRLPEIDSCRKFEPKRIALPLAVVLSALAAAAFAAPLASLAAIVGFAILLAYTLLALKWAAAIAEVVCITQPRNAAVQPADQHLTRLAGGADAPKISIMVPLYRESRIVARLIRRLAQLDYPQNRLEVILLTEDNDAETVAALSSVTLPPMARVLTVPSGEIRTKPRALNYGLDHCTGDIIGVYDAEDAPAPDQLHAVAAGFASGPENLGCLQGKLDYYNPRRNWMARCFTMEYAIWWRVVLPGYARLGLPIPLGGTTLFFKRDILIALGGWDAHNVTEDADLGLRLARRGYVTQLLGSTTFEEANARVLPWIKQRSRWIKGYIMTYAAHMRAPSALLRDLGLWRFFGMQAIFAGTVLQALFAPLLFALWTVPFGLVDPALLGVPQPTLIFMAASGVLCESLMIAIGFAALRRTQHGLSPLWLPTMIFYNLLASLAAYKAVYEVLTKPFYWDKTAHGLFDD